MNRRRLLGGVGSLVALAATPKLAVALDEASTPRAMLSMRSVTVGPSASWMLASLSRPPDALTIAVVALPAERLAGSVQVLDRLKASADCVVVIPDRGVEPASRRMRQTIFAIASPIAGRTLISYDFDAARAVLTKGGCGVAGHGMGTGPDRARDAVLAALHDGPAIETAKGALINIACDRSLKMREVTQIHELVMQRVAGNVDLAYGTMLKPSLKGAIQVSVIGTGIDESRVA